MTTNCYGIINVFIALLYNKKWNGINKKYNIQVILTLNDNILLRKCKHDKINLGLFDVTKITEFINSVVAFPVNSSLIFDGKNQVIMAQGLSKSSENMTHQFFKGKRKR